MKKLLQIFSKKERPVAIAEEGKAGVYINQKHRQAAEFLNRKVARAPRKTIVLSFVAFCVIAGIYNGYILIGGIYNSHRMMQIPVIKHLPLPKGADSISNRLPGNLPTNH